MEITRHEMHSNELISNTEHAACIGKTTVAEGQANTTDSFTLLPFEFANVDHHRPKGGQVQL